MKYTIRLATIDDAKACHDIYGTYVPGPNVTFTIDNPSVEKYQDKITDTLKQYPFYVAEDESGKILGYCCGEPLRPHDAYKWNVEWTIALAKDTPRRAGIASALYEKFSQTLRAQNFQYMYAVIVDTNEASLAFHTALGFTEVGHFKNAGFKEGDWRGIKWLNRYIGNGQSEVAEPVWFKDFHNEEITKPVVIEK